jgi:hypothetical protein
MERRVQMYTCNGEMLRLAIECGFQVDGHEGKAFHLHHPKLRRRIIIGDDGTYEVKIEGSGFSDFRADIEKLSV